MTEGPPRPYKNYLPQYVLKNVGNWKTHKIVRPGVIEHIARSGEKVYTVRAASTPNGRYNSGTMRTIASLAEKYSGGVVRYTQACNMEFVLDDLSKVEPLEKELKSLGFPVGGWGHHLWNITSCAGYFHCALAATDAPSIAKAVGDEIYRYFSQEELPAKLTIAASGCPSACGGSFLTDISVIGIHTEIPVIIDEKTKGCDLMGTALSCPVGCIQVRQEGGVKKIEIRESLCIGCGLCVAACGGIIFKTPEETDGHAIVVGGKASSTTTGTLLGRIVVPYLPNEPPRYPTTVKVISKIVETWKQDARPGERMAEWIDRIGWEKFFRKTGLPFYPQSMEDLDMRALTTLRVGGTR